MATIYLATVGPIGLRQLGEHNILKADYAANEITKRTRHRVMFLAPRFNEFVVQVSGECPYGLPLSRFYPELGNAALVCVTETARRKDIDAMVQRLAA
jgi:glycine dehydrogenase subunit 1